MWQLRASWCLVVVVSLVWGGKERSTKARRSQPSSQAANFPLRSLDEWKRQSKESLVLICNQLSLTATGSHASLASRLHQHYQSRRPQSNSTQSTSRATESNGNDFPLSDIQEMIRNEITTVMSQFNLQRENSQSTSVAVSSDSSQTPAETQTDRLPLNNTNAYSDAVNSVRPQNSVLPGTRNQNMPVPPLQRSRLPPLPSVVLDQIKQSKFINFDLLLPPSITSSAPDSYAIQVESNHSNPTISLVPGNKNRPKVTDFYSWSMAWSTYMQAMAFYHPESLPDLIMYQSIITRFASQYAFSAWSVYDRLFRYRAASDPATSWAEVDDTLFNLYVRGGALRAKCFRCSQYGHLANNCPKPPSNSHSSGSASSHTHNTTAVYVRGASNYSPSANPPFRAPQQPSSANRRLTCRYFNSDQGCRIHQCPFPPCVCQLLWGTSHLRLSQRQSSTIIQWTNFLHL